MKRRLTMNALAVAKGLFEKRDEVKELSTTFQLTAITTGDIVEFVGFNDSDRVLIRWHDAVCSISLEAWSTAEPV